jgi:hypothetical protein
MSQAISTQKHPDLAPPCGATTGSFNRSRCVIPADVASWTHLRHWDCVWAFGRRRRNLIGDSVYESLHKHPSIWGSLGCSAGP